MAAHSEDLILFRKSEVGGKSSSGGDLSAGVQTQSGTQRGSLLHNLRAVLDNENSNLIQLNDKVGAIHALRTAFPGWGTSQDMSFRDVILLLAENLESAQMDAELLRYENRRLQEHIEEEEGEKSATAVDIMQLENELQSTKRHVSILKSENSRLQKVLMSEVSELDEEVRASHQQYEDLRNEYEASIVQLNQTSKTNADFADELLRVTTVLAEKEDVLSSLAAETKPPQKTRRRTSSLSSGGFGHDVFRLSYSQRSDCPSSSESSSMDESWTPKSARHTSSRSYDFGSVFRMLSPVTSYQVKAGGQRF